MWMTGPAPADWFSRRVHKRVEGRELTPRVAASVIAAAWTIGVVVFGILERLIDPNTFDNVWLGMWWALQTVTTVGYGDVVPESTAGKLIGSFLMLGGLSLIAVVTGAITSVFVAQAQARARRRAGTSDPVVDQLEKMTAELTEVKAELTRLQRSGE
jgi:voltage-gated potassium channel